MRPACTDNGLGHEPFLGHCKAHFRAGFQITSQKQNLSSQALPNRKQPSDPKCDHGGQAHIAALHFCTGDANSVKSWYTLANNMESPAMRAQKDAIKEKGAAAFGTRLRRLSERLDGQVEVLYRARRFAFEPRWFPIVVLLSERGSLSVGELAALIGITHAAVSQVRGELVRERIVRGKIDPKDRRRLILELTNKGKKLSRKLHPLWNAVAAATEALWMEVSPSFLKQIERIELALERTPMDVRAEKILSRRGRRHSLQER